MEKDFTQFNVIRGALGFTGITKQTGKEISIMGTGMGMPSTGIYIRELIRSYNVKQIIRVGSCGSLQKDVNLRDVILVQGSCFDSSINTKCFRGLGFAPIANWDLLFKAQQAAEELSIPIKVGNNFSTDEFYEDYLRIPQQTWRLFAKYGVLTIEMESALLYTMAAWEKIPVLSILTVSDNLVTETTLDSMARQTTFSDMIKIALKI